MQFNLPRMFSRSRPRSVIRGRKSSQTMAGPRPSSTSSSTGLQARAESGAEYEKPARTREEEEQFLREFVATAPACGVPVESKIVDTTTGFAACDFTQSIGAELLVVPAPKHVEGAVPSMMDWALQVIPCSLWIVRET